MKFSWFHCSRSSIAVWGAAALTCVAGAACGEALPADVRTYQDDCVLMTPERLEPRQDDPHEGFKHVYGCNLSLQALRADERPFAKGTLIIKESIRAGEDFAWLVATARKKGDGKKDGWQWDEYTRNFADEDLRRIPVGQNTCIDCHKAAAEVDFIFTSYSEAQ